MSIAIGKLPVPFGARVDGVKAQQADRMQRRQLLDALLRHRFIVLHDQQLTHDEYIAFARHWGRPVQLIARKNTLEQHPEMIVQSNREATPEYLRNVANHWHCDSSYEAEVATFTMLYGVEAPEQQGETWFADLVAAYEALPAAERARYDSLQVNHATSAATPLPDERIMHPRELPEEIRSTVVHLDPVIHPLVQAHPVNGRKALYGLGGSCYGIVGMPEEEAHTLLSKLRRYVTQERFCSQHKLMPGEVMIWDNCSVLHRATPIEYSDAPGQRRLNYRISLKGLPDCC